ncbi:MAG: DUF374 domain-containing protein [Puniceicoccaceae bacterium]
MFRRYLLPRLIYGFYRTWSATWRIRIVESEFLTHAMQHHQPVLFAHWHRDELAVLHCVARYRIATMTSRSKDGQLIDYVIRRMGGATSKGSSSRGGSEALRGLLRLMKSGYNGSIAVDGPRGPIYKAKPGVFEIAKLAHCAIIPTGVASQHRRIFERSWNKARLPYPFSRVVIHFGEPIWVQDLTKEGIRSLETSEHLESAIRRGCQRARDLGREHWGNSRRSSDGFTDVSDVQ